MHNKAALSENLDEMETFISGRILEKACFIKKLPSFKGKAIPVTGREGL
jgi:hypothetical protein